MAPPEGLSSAPFVGQHGLVPGITKILPGGPFWSAPPPSDPDFQAFALRSLGISPEAFAAFFTAAGTPPAAPLAGTPSSSSAGRAAGTPPAVPLSETPSSSSAGRAGLFGFGAQTPGVATASGVADKSTGDGEVDLLAQAQADEAAAAEVRRQFDEKKRSRAEKAKAAKEAKNAAKADVDRLKKEMESSAENFFGDLEFPTEKEQLESNLQDRAILFQSEFAEKLQLLENDMIDEECLSNAKNEFQSFLDQNVSNSTALNSQNLAELKSEITTEVQNKKDSAKANIDSTLSAWRKEIGEFEEAELSNFLSELCSLEVLVEAKASVVDDTEKGSFELQMFEDEFDDAISELEAHFASIQIAVNNEFGAEKERRKKEREQEEQRKRDAEEAARKVKELEVQRKRDAEETARKVKELEEQKKEAARKLEELEEQRKREAREAEERRKREAREAEERRRNWSPPVQTYHQPWAPAPAPAPAPRRNVILKKDGTPDRRYKGQRNMY